VKETPILEQYKKIKEKYREELLLFRMGDFYELFYDDAKKASEALGIVLTSKAMGKNIRVPLAGIPVKAAEQYIQKLLNMGYKVAICEQVGEGKKLMKREVVEVITPGTVLQEGLLDEKSHSYIAVLIKGDDGKGYIAVSDISTGDFFVMEDEYKKIIEKLRALDVKELLAFENVVQSIELKEFNISVLREDTYFYSEHVEKIKNFFGVSELSIFGLNDSDGELIKVASLLLHYLEEKKPGMLSHIKGIRKLHPEEYLFLDPQSVKNLELISRWRTGEKAGTLYDIMDRTMTALGARFLKETILSPPRNTHLIKKRLKRVETLTENKYTLDKIRKKLQGVYDIERIVAKISSLKHNSRDFIKLRDSIKEGMEIFEILKEIDPFPEEYCLKEELIELKEVIERIVVDDPPLSPPGVVKDGVSHELDELRDLLTHSKEKILELEAKERDKTGIQNLKIKYNQVFGYYFEVTKSNLNKVPDYFIRKQTLVNAERFFTRELKELEEKILSAEERSVEIEKEILGNLSKKIISLAVFLKEFADALKEIDLIQSFAFLAIERNYTKPVIREDTTLIIKEGRHPVVEVTLGEPFIPNDTFLDTQEHMVYIITGPNMSGKSTYLRQVALITIMAHMGSFVPASYAEIPLTDRIFSRIGASDDLSRGVSTFMAEMLETAEILHNATPQSLIILDEVGRGTSTYDGLAIAWSTVEYIIKHVQAKTLFATHYHELSELKNIYPQVKNFTMKIREWENEIIFMRKLVEGVCDKSYGIHVAALAGLPLELIEKAKEISVELEKKEEDIKNKMDRKRKQLTLFSPPPSYSKVIDLLKQIDPDGITPRDALNLLYKIKEELEK